MRRILWLIGGTAAAFLAAAAVFVTATLPPSTQRFVPSSRDPRLVWGAYHVHSNRSDGSGTPDEIAAAAARAGLQFVVLTDHGDGMAPPSASYRHGVLCIDAAEINSEGGHIVALNLQRASPYPLAGEARDVIEDIHRLGGWAVAAHPESPRPELRWRAAGTGVDGFEWLNLDSEWRVHTRNTLLAAGLRAIVRGPETLGSLLEQGSGVVERWDRARRDAFTIAALDAHARIGADSTADSRSWRLAFPGYETLFRTAAQVAVLKQPLSGDAAADASSVLQAITTGQSYSVVRAFAELLTPIEFWASNVDGRATLAGRLPTETGMLHVVASVPALSNVEVALLQDGRRIASARREVRYDAPSAPGRYRMEAFVSGHRFPWLVSNAIAVGIASPTEIEQTRISRSGHSGPPIAGSGWQIEKDRTSTASVDASADSTRLRFSLGAGKPAGQYSFALAAPAGPDPIEFIEFTASSSVPMRVSLQVRAPAGPSDRRWRRSVYVDGTPRTVKVRLADLDPVERGSPLRPVVARLQSVLIVVDTVNTLPGSSGEITIRDVRFVRGSAGDAGSR